MGERQTVWARLTGKTPKFWVKVRKWMIGCGTLGAGLTAAKSQYGIEFLDAEYCHYLIVIGVVGTFLASLTIDNAEQGK